MYIDIHFLESRGTCTQELVCPQKMRVPVIKAELKFAKYVSASKQNRRLSWFGGNQCLDLCRAGEKRVQVRNINSLFHCVLF